MTENERIKQVRKSMNLTLEAFGQRIGVTRAAISNIENGIRSVTEQMRRSVCREFGVNENWLLAGEGEMFEKTVSHVLDAAVKQYHLTQKDRTLIEKFMELPPDARGVILEYIERAAAALRQLDEDEERQIERDVAEYERQLREEKGRAEKSSASPDTDSDTKMA